MSREAIAFQTDVCGQVWNDMFLAEFADSVKAHIPATLRENWRTWTEMMDDYQNNADEWDWEPVYEIETALADSGYEVVWDGGVFIYEAEQEESDATS